MEAIQATIHARDAAITGDVIRINEDAPAFGVLHIGALAAVLFTTPDSMTLAAHVLLDVADKWRNVPTQEVPGD